MVSLKMSSLMDELISTAADYSCNAELFYFLRSV
jgi:hypothetical protein